MALDTNVRGSTGALADVDATLGALQVTPKGVAKTRYNPDDFTLDSFERLRVSEPRVVFEYTFGALTPTLATTIWEAMAYGAGTEALTANLYGVNLNTTTASGTGRWIQSYNHIRYAPGVSTLLRFTFNFNALTTNVIQRVGMFTDQGTFPSTAGDGLFLEANGSVISFVRRSMATSSGGTEERVTQANWNLDKLDGTGASGVSLNWANAQHLVIEYQWLGVGTIRFGFETGAGGIVWAHEMVSVNAMTTAWSRTGCLPVRAEIYTTGAIGVANTLTLINCTVIQEGDVLAGRGWRYFGANSGPTPKVGGTVAGLYPVISLRAATTNDLTKRTRFIPTSITIAVVVAGTGQTLNQCALLMNPTPNTGATFGGNTPGSAVTYDTAATASTSITGTQIWSALVPNVIGTYTFDLSDLDDSANVVGYNASGAVGITGSAVLALAAGPLTGTSTVGASITASINWKELV